MQECNGVKSVHRSTEREREKERENVCRKTCVLDCLGGASLHLDFAIRGVGVGPPTTFRRNGQSVPWVSLPGPTGVMTHPG